MACSLQCIPGGGDDGACYVVALLRENAVKRLIDMIFPADREDHHRYWQSAFGTDRADNHLYCMTDFLFVSVCIPVFLSVDASLIGSKEGNSSGGSSPKNIASNLAGQDGFYLR